MTIKIAKTACCFVGLLGRIRNQDSSLLCMVSLAKCFLISKDLCFIVKSVSPFTQIKNTKVRLICTHATKPALFDYSKKYITFTCTRVLNSSYLCSTVYSLFVSNLGVALLHNLKLTFFATISVEIQPLQSRHFLA